MNKPTSGQAGFITVEFLIAIAIAFGLTIMTFALTFTLSTVEAFQYIVYSTSRAHAAASYDMATQKKAAKEKYESLLADPAFKSLFSNGWFEVSKSSELEIKSGSGDNFERDYSDSTSRKNLQGVRAKFTAHLLEMRFPFLGSVSQEDGKGFTTQLNAILIREVSHKECNQYMEDRKEALWDFGGSRFSKFRKGTTIPTPWEDNGC